VTEKASEDVTGGAPLSLSMTPGSSSTGPTLMDRVSSADAPYAP
jgi:hypothetical protein